MKEFALNLHGGFLAAVANFPDRQAVEISHTSSSYQVLYQRSIALAATLVRAARNGSQSFTAICTSRSEIGYAGLLSALFRGHAYIPLSPDFPAARNSSILERSGCVELVIDEAGERHCKEIFDLISRPLVVVLPHRSEARDLQHRWGRHHFLTASDIAVAGNMIPRPVDPDAIAYILFTSGSTGEPKGVMISHRAASSMVQGLSERYSLTETDRLSQFADLTWDPSVVDMFLAWKHGACVCCPPKASLIDPSQFIIESRLTMTHMVPSIAVGMKRLGRLKVARYPLLRYIMLGGEPLPMEIAQALSGAAPHAEIDNIYGATEYCIFSAYRWNSNRSPKECYQGWVPIGHPLPGGQACVVDEDMKEITEEKEGSLLISGPQLFRGYWGDLERTRKTFFQVSGRVGEKYYRIGDVVRRSTGDAMLHFVGRKDGQIKINGVRIELGEIESALRKAADSPVAFAYGWPPTQTGFGGIIGFLEEPCRTPAQVMEELKGQLPGHMMPRTIRVLNNLPRNANGKYDRLALRRLLDQGQFHDERVDL